jgi:hypothetical protein
MAPRERTGRKQEEEKNGKTSAKSEGTEEKFYIRSKMSATAHRK